MGGRSRFGPEGTFCGEKVQCLLNTGRNEDVWVIAALILLDTGCCRGVVDTEYSQKVMPDNFPSTFCTCMQFNARCC